MSSVTFKTTKSGGDPARHVLRLRDSLKPSAEALLYAGQRQRSRIIERTERGVDVDGKPFAPYSKTRMYWCPNAGLLAHHNKRVGNLRAKESIAIYDRLLGMTKRSVKRYFKKITSSEREKSKGVAPYITKSGLYICFPLGYDQFKKYLGRFVVDLTGPRAPHMLQAIVVTADGQTLKVGVYGPKAAIAKGHNEGAGNLPKRVFLSASKEDLREMVKDIGDFMMYEAGLKGRG